MATWVGWAPSAHTLEWTRPKILPTCHVIRAAGSSRRTPGPRGRAPCGDCHRVAAYDILPRWPLNSPRRAGQRSPSSLQTHGASSSITSWALDAESRRGTDVTSHPGYVYCICRGHLEDGDTMRGSIARRPDRVGQKISGATTRPRPLHLVSDIFLASSVHHSDDLVGRLGRVSSAVLRPRSRCSHHLAS